MVVKESEGEERDRDYGLFSTFMGFIFVLSLFCPFLFHSSLRPIHDYNDSLLHHFVVLALAHLCM